jgi:acyl-CoA thioester hydrolase
MEKLLFHPVRIASGLMADRWPEVAGRRVGDIHILPVRIYFEDTDFSGRVYHASYLRFMERGRSDWLRSLGVSHNALHRGEGGERAFFAVQHMDIDFLKPASIDDVVEVETGIVEASGARIVLDQRIIRGADVLIRAAVTVALVNAAGKPRRIPATIRQLVRRVPGG